MLKRRAEVQKWALDLTRFGLGIWSDKWLPYVPVYAAFYIHTSMEAVVSVYLVPGRGMLARAGLIDLLFEKGCILH